MPVVETAILTYVVIEGVLQWSINIHYLFKNWNISFYSSCCSVRDDTAPSTPELPRQHHNVPLLRQHTPQPSNQSPIRFRLKPPI
jgi:hypothetical protein